MVPEGLAATLAETMRDVTKPRGGLQLCPVGSLPNEGKVSGDAREYV